MTPDERQMLEDFFGRVSSTNAGPKDRAADALIAQEMKRNPDAAYTIVQTALVYEHQMADLEERIRDLEAQVEEMSTSGNQGSFLGGRLGQGRAPQQGSAGYGRVRPEALERELPEDTARRAAPSPWSQAPEASRAPQPAQGGGFLRSAMATAAGVAGGLMLGDGLRGLFGGGEAHASGSERSAGDQAALADADRTQDELQDELAQRDADDDAAQDADFGSDDGSFDV